jgi:hypothetical protein
MLGVNQIIGFGAGGNKPPASISFSSTAEIDVGGSTFTFSNQSIGAYAPNRKVIVSVQSASSIYPSTVTYNGINMTKLASSYNVNSFWYINEDNATTATIVVTDSGAPTDCRVCIWRILNAPNEPLDIQYTIGSNSASVNVACSNGSVVVAASSYQDNNAGSYTCTWTGVTERADNVFADATTCSASVADASVGTATSLTVTSTWTNSSVYECWLLAVSF